MLQRISPSFDRERERERAVSSTYDFRVRFGFLLLLLAVETGQHFAVFSSSSKTRHNAAVRLSVLLRLMDTSCGARMGLATTVTTTAGEARTRLSMICVCVCDLLDTFYDSYPGYESCTTHAPRTVWTLLPDCRLSLRGERDRVCVMGIQL